MVSNAKADRLFTVPGMFDSGKSIREPQRGA